MIIIRNRLVGLWNKTHLDYVSEIQITTRIFLKKSNFETDNEFSVNVLHETFIYNFYESKVCASL